MSLAAVLMFAAFFAGAAIGVPIGHAMIATGFLYLWVHGGDMGLVATQGLNGLFKSFVLLAVPLYVLFELGMILLVIFPPGDRVNKKDGESQATKEPPVAADEDEPVANQPEPPALPGPSDDDE